MIERRCNVLDLGFLDYRKAWTLQKELVEKRFHQEIPDTLIMVEHPPVFTIGRSGSRQNIHVSDEYLESLGIPVYEVDRGGDITYHGPGQLIGYPILDLNGHGRDVHLLLRSLEEVLIRLLADYGVKARRAAGYTGVWVEDEKIASIGIGVRRWTSFHGFCLNVNPDMKCFSMISPCGIKDKAVTSLSSSLYRPLASTASGAALPENRHCLRIGTALRCFAVLCGASPYPLPSACARLCPQGYWGKGSEGVSGKGKFPWYQEMKEKLIRHFGDVFTVEMEDMAPPRTR